MLVLTVWGTAFQHGCLLPKSETVAVKNESEKVTAVNLPFKQNGQGLPKAANSTEIIGVPQGLTGSFSFLGGKKVHQGAKNATGI